MKHLTLFVVLLTTGCAANRVSFSEQHWYANGIPKSSVSLNQMQIATWKSGVEDGDNSFVRLDDQSIESGNKSSATTSSVDPNLLLATLAPLFMPVEAAGPVVQKVGGVQQLLEAFRILQGVKK